jgi:hypothetical protein
VDSANILMPLQAKSSQCENDPIHFIFSIPLDGAENLPNKFCDRANIKACFDPIVFSPPFID